LNALHGLWNC